MTTGSHAKITGIKFQHSGTERMLINEYHYYAQSKIHIWYFKTYTITSLFMFGWIFFKILKMKTKIRWAYDQVTQVFVAMIIIRLHWMSLRHRYYGVLSILKWEHLYRFCSFGSQLWHLFACLPNGYWIHTCLRKLSFCESMLIFAALKWTPSSRVAFLQRRLNSWKCMINVSQFL